MDFMVWTLKGKHSIKRVYFGKIGTKLRMNQITSIVIHNGIVTQFRFDSLGKHLARSRMNYMPYKKPFIMFVLRAICNASKAATDTI